MALTPDNSTALITQFQGSSQSQDSYDVDPNHGLYSRNCDFIMGQAESIQAATRRGVSQLGQVPNTDGAISALASWFFSYNGAQDTLVAMYSATNGVRFYDQLANAFSEIVIAVTGAAGAIFVTDGLRIYAAFYDFSGRKGVAQARVFGLLNGAISPGNEAVDTLFASPLPATIAAVTTLQPFAGVVTAGTHRVGYIFLTRNGDAASLLNPVTADGVFSPVTFTADGTKNLNVFVTFSSIPTYLNPTNAPVTPTLQVVMTSASNLNEYYLVPGATVNVPATPGAAGMVVNITDGDLVTGTNVTLNQNQLSAVNNAGPFNPWSIFTYSSRMAYCTLDSAGFPVIYFSDANDYQSISAATSGVYLEGRQIPVQGCSLGVCYLATVASLYSVQDNGGDPTTWTEPQRIDGSIGILSPTCMLAAGGKILMASEKGLYLYRGGAFPQIPISYWQSPDWNRINWAQPTQVSIVDDSQDKVLRVLAPLNMVIIGATNTNPITITTGIIINGAPVATPHLFQTGLRVTNTGVLGNTAANTTQAITVTGPTTFTIPVAGNGAYVSGGKSVPQSPNAEMCWAYPAGDAPGQCFYSIHAFTSYRAQSMATIRNIATNLDEVWFSPASSNPGGLIRRVTATSQTPYRDVDMAGNPSAIDALYETSNLPGSQDEAMTLHDYHGMHFRISGAGNLNVTAYSLDHALAVTPAASPFALSPRPGQEYRMLWYLRSEQETIAFGTNAIDAFFLAALLRVYYSESLPMR